MAQAFLGRLVALVLLLSLACSAYAIAPEPAPPKWAQLNSQQQTILTPLAGDWDGLTDFRKRKWIGIAKRYPSMRPEEQQNLQSRMREWANLSMQQRRRVREKFKEFDKLPPEKKLTVRQKWEEYQRLPEEEKRKLAEIGSKPPPAPALRAPRGAVKTLPPAAAPAPVTPPAVAPAQPASATTGQPQSGTK